MIKNAILKFKNNFVYKYKFIDYFIKLNISLIILCIYLKILNY